MASNGIIIINERPLGTLKIDQKMMGVGLQVKAVTAACLYIGSDSNLTSFGDKSC